MCWCDYICIFIREWSDDKKNKNEEAPSLNRVIPCNAYTCELEENSLQKNIVDEEVKNFGECCVCLEPLQKNLYAMPCAHLFHENCIREWLKKHTKCPICEESV